MGGGRFRGKNIQQIKPSFTGFHSNWQVHTHRRYMIKKTVTKLKKLIAEDDFENLSKVQSYTFIGVQKLRYQHII